MERAFSIQPLLINHQSQPGKNSWVKIFIYEPADASIFKTRGTMYAVLSVSAKSNIDFTAIMQMILEDLHTQYFQQTTGGVLQTLEIALDGIHKKLILMGQQDKKLGEGFKFNLLTAVSWGTVLYFGELGSSRAALYREGKLFDIDEGPQKTTNLYLSSGVLQTNDRILLGTEQLFKRFNRTTLKKILSKPKDKIVNELEKELDAGPSRVEQSGIVLAVDIKQVPTVEDEAFNIKDPNTLKAAPATMKAATRKIKLGGLKRFFSGIVSWKLANKIPILPVVLAVVALTALAYSLSGGQVWQPEFGPNQELIESADQKITQAQEVASINPDRAQDLLEQAKHYLDQGLQNYPQNEQLLSLKSKYEQLTQQILIVNELQTTTITDLNIVPTQPKLVLQDSLIYVVDSREEKLVSISQFGQTQTVSTDHHFSRGSLLTTSDNGLLLVSRGKVMPVGQTGQLGQPEQLADTVQSVAIAGFGQNGYVLEAAGQIYRLPNMVDSIGQTSRYFINPISGEDLVDIAVDGSIYLLRGNGSVELYLNGLKQQLTLERASLIHDAQAIFASPELPNIYILQKNAMLAWSKNGKYLGQYQLPQAQEWQMATIDAENKSIYILSNNQLLKASLP